MANLGALLLTSVLLPALVVAGSSLEDTGKQQSLNESHSDSHTLLKQFSQILSSSSGQLKEKSSSTSSLFETESADVGIESGQLTSLSSAMLKAYIRANNMRAYHLDLHSYRPEAKFAGDPKFVESQSGEHKARCWRHLSHFRRLLESHHQSDPVLSRNSLDSIRLADSFGRPEAGLLRGSQFWLGDHDSCMEFSTRAGEELLRGHYCLAVTQYPNWNPQDSKTSVKIGLCLPDSCTSSMLNEQPQMFQSLQEMVKLQLGSPSRGPYSKLTVRELYCLPHESSPARQFSYSALCLLALLGSFLVGCLAATLIDHKDRSLEGALDKSSRAGPKSSRAILVESFSITRNLDRFFRLREEPKELEEPEAKGAELASDQGHFNRATFLNSITGLKCIGLCWIIAAHTFLVAPIPARNIIDADKWTSYYLADLFLTAHLMVDTFFCLSGALAAYFLFRTGLEGLRLRQWLVLTLHRYWRLAPIYLLCYWYAKSLGHLLSSGPLWDYATAAGSPRLNCQRESWWQAVLLLSDFKSPKEHCVPFAWFIANGIKFWIATPLFLYAINRSVRRGYALAGATLAANTLLVGALAFRSPVDMKSVVEFKPESADNMLNEMGEIYTRPYSRFGAYLIGLLFGHFVYLLDTKQASPRLSKNANAIMWTIFSTLVFALTFMLKLASSLKLDEAAIPLTFAICSALIRPIWSLCTCWLVYSLATGQARGLANFLSAKFWRILVKVSFCAYLIQGEVIAQLFLSQASTNHHSYVDLISKPIETIVLTILLSFLMVLFVEYPLTGIEQLILPSKRSPQRGVMQGPEVTQPPSSCLTQTQANLLPPRDTDICSREGAQEKLKVS